MIALLDPLETAFERQTFVIRVELDAVEARRHALSLALRHGSSPVRAYGFATAVSELANNLVFHASRGGQIEIVARPGLFGRHLEVTATDDGPGIADVNLAMQDGYSTAGTLGCGLPGTKRLADEFDIVSTIGVGTRVTCAIWLP